MRGRTLAVTFLLALISAAPARAGGDPIMPLSEVRAGMRCVGYSVFKGTAVEPFDVEVLDVVGGTQTGGSDPRILVRVSGPAVDVTGIGPGFSGSPIYCAGADGVPRNIGAISETIGDYGGKVVLATPIEQMLGVPVDAPAAVTPTEARRARASGRADAALLARARSLTSPLTVRGLDRGVFAALSKAASRRGITLLQAPPAPVAEPPGCAARARVGRRRRRVERGHRDRRDRHGRVRGRRPGLGLRALLRRCGRARRCCCRTPTCRRSSATRCSCPTRAAPTSWRVRRATSAR